MSNLVPFADEATELEIGGFTVENREDRVSLFGSLELTKDKSGLRLALELMELVTKVVAELEGLAAKGDLPEQVELEPPETRGNPFS